MPYLWDGGPVTSRKLFDRKMFYVSFNEGITVVRNDEGVWSELDPFEVDAVVQSYDTVLTGGHVTEVSDAHYAELVAAGYGSYLTAI